MRATIRPVGVNRPAGRCVPLGMGSEGRDEGHAPSRRVIAAWSAVMLAVAGLACVAGFVGAPVWRTCRAVARCGRGEADVRLLTRELGEGRTAARRLKLYLRLPERVAPHRLSAALMLSTCGEDALVALPEIARALEGNANDVRLVAARALAEAGDPRATQHLLDFLGPGDDLPLGLAAETLGEIGDRRAVEPLAGLLKSEIDAWEADLDHMAERHWNTDRERAAVAAASALGRLKDPRGVPALVALLEFGRETGDACPSPCRCGLGAKRRAAVAALAEMGEPAIPALIRCLGLVDRAGVFWGRGQLYGGPHGLLPDLHRDPKVGACAARILVRIGPASIAPLVDALASPDQQSRKYATEALVEFGEPAVEPLLAALGRAEPEVRWRAAAALGEIGDRRAIEALLRLLGDPEPKVREWAAASLGRLRDRRAAGPLAAALEDAEAGVRVQAVWALKALADLASADALLVALDDGHPHVRRGAAVALAATRDPRALGTLLLRLGDAHAAVRGGAAEGLGLLADRRALPALNEIRSDSNSYVAEVVRNSIAALEPGRPGHSARQEQ